MGKKFTGKAGTIRSRFQYIWKPSAKACQVERFSSAKPTRKKPNEGSCIQSRDFRVGPHTRFSADIGGQSTRWTRTSAMRRTGSPASVRATLDGGAEKEGEGGVHLRAFLQWTAGKWKTGPVCAAVAAGP